MAPKPEKREKPELGNVLVTGGCGMLGYSVVNRLLKAYKASVAVVDLRCPQDRRITSGGVKYYEADITDPVRLMSIFDEFKPQVVIHTAAPIPQSDAKNNKLYEKVNVHGTRVIIDACQETGVKALVYTSSASVLSDNENDLINATEEFPVIRGKEQTEYYSETKAAAEELVLNANRTGDHNLLTAVIRPSGIIGEGDRMIIYHLVNIYKQGKHTFQMGGNDNLFDFTYVENVAHGHLLAAEALLQTHSGAAKLTDEEKVDGEAFIITNDAPVYFWDFSRAVWRAAGANNGTQGVWHIPRELGLVLGSLSEVFFWIIRKPPTFNRQRILYSCMTRYFDITKAKRRLGYKPLVALGDGIRRSVKWQLDHDAAKLSEKAPVDL